MKAREVVVFMTAMANNFLELSHYGKSGAERVRHWRDQVFLNTSFRSVMLFSPIR
jgi:hypothetical protein